MSPLSLERYRGEPIEITTLNRADGTWTASAILPSGEPLPSSGQHPTEAAAKSEALSTAVAAMDRARSSIGKP